MNRLQRAGIVTGTFIWILLMSTFIYAKKEEKALEASLIRFHILAHSDDQDEQTLKLKVRDAVLAAHEKELRELQNVKEAKRYLQYIIPEIQQTAEAVVRESGYDHEVQVSLTTDAFPTKKYGNICLPAGYYQSLRIEIGEASGHNWWCVMFPPICYSMEEEELPADMEEALDSALKEETNGLIHYEEADLPIRFRFKIVEIWNRLEQWIAT